MLDLAYGTSAGMCSTVGAAYVTAGPDGYAEQASARIRGMELLSQQVEYPVGSTVCHLLLLPFCSLGHTWVRGQWAYLAGRDHPKSLI